MNTKTTLITLATTGLLLLNPLNASAQTAVTASAKATAVSIKATNKAAQLARVHVLADNAINLRLTALNSVATRISGLVKLSSDQKTQFNSEVTADINGLTSLKAKCDADTDLPTLRADYKTIYTTYRLYVEFLPQLHLLIAADTMGVTASKLADLASKLQIRIQTAGNPSNLTGLLSDLQAKVADSKSQYATVESQIINLTPQSFDNDPTGTKSTVLNARSELKQGGSDLRTAWSDAIQIFQALKASVANPSPTVSK